MHVELLTPEGKVFEGEAVGVQVPGTDGSFEVLKDHAPIISTLIKGLVTVRIKNQEPKTYTILGGLIEMQNNQVVILADKIQKDSQ